MKTHQVDPNDPGTCAGFAQAVFLEMSQDRMWAVNQHYELIWGNRIFHEHIKIYLGRAIQNGESVFTDKVSEEVVKEWKGYYDRAIKKGEEFLIEITTKTLPEKKVIEYHFRPCKLPDGNVCGVSITGKDVTKFTQTLDALSRSEIKYRSLVEQSGEALFLHDMHGKILDVNHASTLLTRYSREELLQMTVFDLDPDAAKRLDKEAIWESLNNEEVKTIKVRHLRKDGSYYPAEVTIGKVTISGEGFLLSLARDITEHQEAEQKLIVERDRAKLYLNLAGFIYLGINKEGNIILVNRKGCELLGEREEELLGKNWFDNFIPANIREQVKKVFRQLMTGKVENVEFYENPLFTKENGERLIAWHNVLLYDKEGNITGSLSSGEDITERRRAEERLSKSEEELRNLVQNAPIGIYRSTPDGRILLANPALVKMLGFDSFEELASRNLLNEGYGSEKSRESFLKLIEKDNELHGFETVWTKKNGEEIIVSENARMVKDDKGEILYYEGMVEDITEKKQFHEELRTSEERSRALLTAIPDLMFRMDKNGVYLDYKAATSELFYQKEDIIGKNNHDITPADFSAMVDEKIQLTLKTGTMQEFEYQLDMPGKGIQDYEARMVPATEEEVITIVRNITDRKLIQKKLAESELNARAIMESTNDVLILLDKEGIVIDSNDAHARRLGLTRKELLGRNVFSLLPPDIAKRRKEIIHEVTTTGKPAVGEDFRGGYWNEYTIYPIFQDGSVTDRVAVFSRDVTNRKRNEEIIRQAETKYQTLFENLAQGIFYQSANGKIVDANDAALKILGLNREQILGKDSYDERWKVINEDYEMLSPDQHPSMIALRTGKPVMNHTIGIYIPEKDTYNWVILEAIPQFMPGEVTPFQVFATMQDITSRKMAEMSIADNEQRLRDLNASKDKFFSIIAHDLRSPFNAIMGFSDLILDQIKQKDYEGLDEMAEVVLKSSTFAMDLLTNLLEWSRAQTGRLHFEPAFIEIIGLINENIELLKSAAGHKNIRISTQMPNVAPVLADKAMISTILRNLISNAIKFTPSGGEILITCRSLPENIHIAVQDNGVGIDPKDIPKLFRIDQNFTTYGTNREKGTGLGLILCKEFVEKHKGKIWVESEQGKGSVFTFTLPKSN